MYREKLTLLVTRCFTELWNLGKIILYSGSWKFTKLDVLENIACEKNPQKKQINISM